MKPPPRICTDCGRLYGSLEAMELCTHATGLHSWTENRPADARETLGKGAGSIGGGKPVELHLQGHRFVFDGGLMMFGFADGFGAVLRDGMPGSSGLDEFVGAQVVGTKHPAFVIIGSGDTAASVLRVLREANPPKPEGTT